MWQACLGFEMPVDISEPCADIERWQAILTARFNELRVERGDAPRYLLEHGLNCSEITALKVAIRSALRRHPIESSSWSARALPLLVAATEIGYVYRGTGTEFWPIFAEQLGETSIGDRAALSALFRQAAEKFGLASPPETPWNLAFCHIAWPILHAILPIELHQSLARALRDVRTHLDLGVDDNTLLAPIRNRARLAGGVRLIGWLENVRTAAAVVRQFLQPLDQHGVANSALERIAADLALDEAANSALREARKRQNALVAKPKTSSRGRGEIVPRFAPLVLRMVEQHVTIALKIPQLKQDVRDTARSALEAIRWRAFLWATGRPVPGRNIFSDFPLPLFVDKLPGPDVPLFADANVLPLEQQAKQFLGSLRVASDAPLLFSDFADDGDALQRNSGSIAAIGHCIVLVEPNIAPPPKVEHLGVVAGLRAYRLDLVDLTNQAWLSELGFAVSPATRLTWIGNAEIEQHRPVRRFNIGTFIAFELNALGGSCEARLTGPSGQVSILNGEGVLLAGFVAAETGIYRIRYGAGEEQIFEVAEIQADLELLKVDIDVGSGATADLADRYVTLRFDSSTTVQEAEIELVLRCDGREVKRLREPLPDTPCALAGDHIIWEHLLDPDTVENLLSARRADLGVTVPGLLETWFGFEQMTAPFSWERQNGGLLAASDESGALLVFTANPERPLALTKANGVPPQDDIQLFRAGHDRPLQVGGYCIGPRIWRAGERAAAHKPERLLRQFSSARENAADGRGVVDALIGWAAAGVDHPVTQFRRGQIVRQLESWMVEQLCGHRWAEREAVIVKRRGQNFVGAFFKACSQLCIGYCDVGLSRAQQALLDRILTRLVEARSMPIALETSREPIGEDLAISLDGLFNDAYTLLCEEIETVGDQCPFSPDDDIDVGEVSENWDRALRAAASEAALIQLVDLLRPLDAGDILSLADFEAMLPDDVVDLLYDWILAHRPAHHARQWNRELVEAAYWLFERPAVAARLSWKAAAERLLADGFSARAIRYAALRAGTSARIE